MRGPGQYFDGVATGRYQVDVRLDAGAGELVFSGPAMPSKKRWPLPWLRALSDRARNDWLMVTLDAECGEAPRDPGRLSLSDPALIKEIRRLCPDLYRKDVKRGAWAYVLRAGAVAALMLMLYVILPRVADALAAIVPG